MKRPMLLLVGLLLIPAVMRSEADSDYTPEFRSTSETFTSKVLKVYAFTDGDVDYVAYVVSWKGHEVVVAPSGPVAPDRRYAIGDTIRCALHQMTRLSGAPVVSQARFSVAPGPEDRPMLDPHDPVAEQGRLEAIRAEVERRRALRESARQSLRASQKAPAAEPTPTEPAAN